MTVNSNIASLYDFTLQQIAAESYFEGIAVGDIPEMRKALMRGTNRLGYPSGAGEGNTSLNQGYPGYTRMTSQQADEFLAKFKIVHQWSDNPSTGTPAGSRPLPEGDPAYARLNAGELLANTGLSATLIRKLDSSGNPANEYTLAIRSTEFRDWVKGGDGQRDATGADASGIAFTGFALAQQYALEQYYQWLKVNKDVAGKLLLPPGAKLNVTGYSLGGNLATVFTEMHQAEMGGGETVTFNGAGRGTWNKSLGGLADITSYYHSILIDPELAPNPGGIGGSLCEAARGRKGMAFDPKTVYEDPRYLWAVSATQAKYSLSWQSLTDEYRTGTAADNIITQLFGFETQDNTNFTANSGTHGPAERVGIEAQPALEGWGGKIGTGDFGNGHSITLIADSLALQRAMNKLDKSFELGNFISLLPATSKRVATNGLGANYEADPLENVLDALRRALLGPTAAKTEFKDGASGFGDITKREGYFANLKALTDSAAFKALEGKLELRPASGDLRGLARGNFGAIVALQDLSPVYVSTRFTADDTLLAPVWTATRYADYNAWLADKTSALPATGFTDQWIEDRSALLQAIVSRNKQNISTGSVNDPLAPAGQVTDFDYIDPASPGSATFLTTQRPGTSLGQHRLIRFGGNTGATLVGTNSQLGDHLYGGAGIDTLKGYAGKDYLEGGAGADTLLGGLDDDVLNGGKDFDSYQIDADGGRDTIQDSDGLGKVTLAGIVLTGGKHVAGTQAVWESADGKVQYQKLYLPASNTFDLLVSVQGSSATARIENWQPSKNLGITLSDEAAPVLTLKNIEQYTAGVFDSVTGSNLSDKIDTGKNTDFVYSGNGDDYVYLGSGKDVANGGAGKDYIDGGTEQDYILGGAILGSAEQASLERDILIGGQGSDLIQGGLGDDILIGAERNTVIDGADQLTQGDWLLGGQGEDIVSGSLARDFINGGAGADSLDGGAGDDIILGDADYDFRTSFGASVSSSAINVAAEHRINEDGSDTVSAALGYTTMPNSLFAFTLDTSGADFVFTPTQARPAEQLVRLVDAGGDDIISGGSGADWIAGQTGADTILAGAGADTVYGDDLAPMEAWKQGNDTIWGDAGDDKLYGGGGDDTLSDLQATLAELGAPPHRSLSGLSWGILASPSSENLLRYPLLPSGTQRMTTKTSPQDKFTQTCRRTRRASMPARLRARGRGVVCTRAALHLRLGLHTNSAATANWLRRCGTATRHVCGCGWWGKESQIQQVHSMRAVGMKWLGVRMDAAGSMERGVAA